MDRQEEFLRMFLRCENDLRAFCGSLIRDPQGCDDLFQDVALTLWKEFDRYDPGRSFGAWARGIAAKKIMQRWSATARLPASFPPAVIQAVSDAYERSEDGGSLKYEALQHCLERLPDKSRRLLAMRYEQSRPLSEIARDLGATLTAIYQALSRLRTSLYECMTRRLAALEADR